MNVEDTHTLTGIEVLLQEGYTVTLSAYGTGLRRRRVEAARDGTTTQGCGTLLGEAVEVCGRQVHRREVASQKGGGA